MKKLVVFSDIGAREQAMSQLKEGLNSIVLWLYDKVQKYPETVKYWWLRYPKEKYYQKPYLNPKLSSPKIEFLLHKLNLNLTSEFESLYQLFDGTKFGNSIWESDWLFDVNAASQEIKGVGLLSLESLINDYREQQKFYQAENYQQLELIPDPLSHVSGLTAFVGQNYLEGCFTVAQKTVLPIIRIREYQGGVNNTIVMYSSLNNMIKTVAESYQRAYFFDGSGQLYKDLAQIKSIWQKYNSSYFISRTIKRFEQVKHKLIALEPDVSSAWLQEIGDVLILTENNSLLQILISILTLPPCNNQLDNNLDNLRSQAARIIIQAQDKKAIPELIKQLDNDYGIARYWTVKTLANLRDPTVIQPLKKLLSDEQSFVRLAAQNALKQLQTTAKNQITMSNNQASNSNRNLYKGSEIRDRLIAETNRLMKTLNFTVEEGKDYLSKHYQKISRLQLTDKELTEFRDYLQNKFNSLNQNSASENTSKVEVIEIEFNELLQQINQLMKQLNWTKEDGKNYLLTHYQKKSRLLLSDGEIIEFRDYLQQEASQAVHHSS